MTAKIPLSQIKAMPDFEARVHAFVQAKKDHLITEGVGAPTEHHVVESAVRRIPGDGKTPDDFVADYTIVDDTMPAAPAPTLDQRKAWAIDAALIEKANPHPPT